jgi:hypothetical protein
MFSVIGKKRKDCNEEGKEGKVRGVAGLYEKTINSSEGKRFSMDVCASRG